MNKMRLLVINGPNINMLGIREPDIYGKQTYQDLCDMICGYAERKGILIEVKQSNHEGEIIDWIQEAYGIDGIIINPAAYTHTSIAILDALKTINLPTIEVHISDISKREPFRQTSYIRDFCKKSIIGHGLNGYLEAIDYLIERYDW